MRRLEKGFRPWMRKQSGFLALVELKREFSAKMRMNLSEFQFILQNKTKLPWTETSCASMQGTLKCRDTDHIDWYFQHRIDLKAESEVMDDVMAGLNREEKIPHWGISESNEDYLRRVHAVCPVTAVENRYSMMACVLGRTTVTGRTTSTCCVAG